MLCYKGNEEKIWSPSGLDSHPGCTLYLLDFEKTILASLISVSSFVNQG